MSLTTEPSLTRGDAVQAVREILTSQVLPINRAKHVDLLGVATNIISRLEEMGALSFPKKGDLTPAQWTRIAYGACHAIIHQVLDNGELDTVDIDEFLPDGVAAEDLDYEELQRVIESQVMSDLWEEQSKRDS